MKNIAPLIALLTLAIGCASSVPDRFDTALDAVDVYDVTNEWQGSGVVIQCDRMENGMFEVLVLTAGHLIHPIEWEAQDFDLYRGDDGDELVSEDDMFVSRHPTLDAALISFVSPVRLDVSPLTYREPRVGERVLAAGYPGDEFYFSEGLIVSSSKMSAQLSPGISGGPVIDEVGRVLGITQGVAMFRIAPGPHWFHVNHQATFVSLISLKSWLREHGVV